MIERKPKTITEITATLTITSATTIIEKNISEEGSAGSELDTLSKNVDRQSESPKNGTDTDGKEEMDEEENVDTKKLKLFVPSDIEFNGSVRTDREKKVPTVVGFHS